VSQRAELDRGSSEGVLVVLLVPFVLTRTDWPRTPSYPFISRTMTSLRAFIRRSSVCICVCTSEGVLLILLNCS